ncbi:DUF6773 family protein [Paenibacillus riograndensis]|uniref:Putative membrane protein n=1 Tax=Paenibacillus riograndensis SBR5 TaxID=1073571 RepID=A0A0E4CY80_9BACL|nr:DUF6773 family protein [Paenibacillus riograndensis]CQR57139.1 putative membrane protein [Paenibacillus riograndensis SBR5]
MGRTNLDERQLQNKHKAGNQAFILLAFLLLADMGLQNYGIHWLEYPMSNYVIFLIGVGSYLVRIIWNGSYAGPGSGNLTANGRSILGAVLAILVALCVITAAWMGSTGKSSHGTGTGPAILMISTAVGLIILGTVFWIRRRNNRDEA